MYVSYLTVFGSTCRLVDLLRWTQSATMSGRMSLFLGVSPWVGFVFSKHFTRNQSATNNGTNTTLSHNIMSQRCLLMVTYCLNTGAAN